MMQKPGDRRLSDRDLFLPESVFEFGQRDVRLPIEFRRRVARLFEQSVTPADSGTNERMAA